MSHSLDEAPRRPRITRRSLFAASAAGAATLATPALVRAEDKVLYVNSQGGSWEAAARKNLFDPFTQETGIQIKTATGMSFAALMLQARNGVYDFDIATGGGAEVVQFMNAGLLQPIDFKIFDRNAIPADMIFENAVGNHVYSTNICFNTTTNPPGSIRTWKDVWDAGKFPGTRSLGRYMSQTIVFALLADGVPKDKLYPIDLDRVFASLDRIKPHVRVWWTTGPQVEQLLGDGEVDMASNWQAHGTALRKRGAPIEMVWNEFTVDRVYWMVCKGTPHAAYAWEFINFAMRPKNNAGFCIDGSYGPWNPKAFDFIPADVAADMPTNTAYAAGAVEYDFRQMGAALTPATRRFERWLQT